MATLAFSTTTTTTSNTAFSLQKPPPSSSSSSSHALGSSFLRGTVSLRVASGRVSVVKSSRSGLAIVANGRKAAKVERDESEVDQRFRLNNLSPQPGSRHRQKRKGRGIAAGQGASCGFGMRGQKSRSGSGVRPGFEGGQMPLYRRLPKLRGIAGGMGAGLPNYVAVNLTDIATTFQEGEEVSLEALKERRVLNPSGRDRKLPLKILGDGELDFKVKIKAGAVSAAAREKLETLGCEFEILPKKKKWVSVQYSKNQARAEAYFAKKRGESA
ncbi:large ribosomal subunit protein uL15c [Physcomitrium patens]|uniref:Large ribosomal subunit protein uL15/eL18 domain-containing protein n=1 Tax=Physcomitrium patens TaxID=3218 RepID=A0A2K1IGC7_PHYPA|nr:50S ribosomal protein L15, chloroplastic-like [Physcomitrium patens]PNR28333.1 hypothetical protein PHYPA_028925 [Physcomitrium patens]|eukprot:XP_024364572.1 50S ribosomal protein L15, chloroplastic-like [Physcomitrella patens]